MRPLRLLLVLFLFACQAVAPAPADDGALGPDFTPAPAQPAPGPAARLLPTGQPLLATQTRTAGPVDVQLASERSAFQPGRPLTVGLIIRHDPGYHTYWRFPGVVGLATSIRWNLPPGFRAGPLRWARPERSVMAGHGVWGYRRDVALLTQITPPLGLLPGALVELKAAAAWMACAKDCNPGFKNFTLRVPVARQAVPRSCAALFSSMRRQTSEPSPSWSFRAEPTSSGFRLIASPRGAPVELRRAYFFNSNAVVDSSRPQRFEARAGGGFVLELDRWELAQPCTILRGVLRCEVGSEHADARYIAVSAPL